jgi:hypothetical protein
LIRCAGDGAGDPAQVRHGVLDPSRAKYGFVVKSLAETMSS